MENYNVRDTGKKIEKYINNDTFLIVVITARPVSESTDLGFSLFGLDTEESWVVIAVLCMLGLLLIIMLIIIITKRSLKLRVTRGQNSAEISMNESARAMMNTTSVSEV